MDVSKLNPSVQRHVVRANASMLAGSMGLKVVWENEFRPRCYPGIIHLPNPGCIFGDHRDFMMVYGSMCHEIGHYNFTKFSEFEVVAKRNYQLGMDYLNMIRSIWNVLEDIYIEASISKLFPGVKGRIDELSFVAAEMGFYDVEDPVSEPADTIKFALLKHLRSTVLKQNVKGAADDVNRACQMFGPVMMNIINIAMKAVAANSTAANVLAAEEIIALLAQESQDAEPSKGQANESADDASETSDESADDSGKGDSDDDQSESDDTSGDDESQGEQDSGDQGDADQSDDQGTDGSDSDDQSESGDESGDDNAPGTQSSDAQGDDDQSGSDSGTRETETQDSQGDAAADGASEGSESAGDSDDMGTTDASDMTGDASQKQAIRDALNGDWSRPTEIVDLAKELHEELIDERGSVGATQGTFKESEKQRSSFDEVSQRHSDHGLYNQIMSECGSRLEDLLLAETLAAQRVSNSGRRLHRNRMCHLDTSASVFEKSKIAERIATAIDVLVDVSSSTFDVLQGNDGQAFQPISRILSAMEAMSEIFSRYEIPLRVNFFSNGYTELKGFDEDWIRARRNGVHLGGGTDTSNALQHFAESLFHRTEERKLLVLVTDGDPGSTAHFSDVAKALPELGIELRIVYIGAAAGGVDGNEMFYRGLAPTAVARNGLEVSHSIYEALASDFDE